MKIKLKFRKYHNPYDLGRPGAGFNRPCPFCGREIDRRAGPYEPIGTKIFCKCRRKTTNETRASN